MELRLLKLVFVDNCIDTILKFVDENGKFHYYKEKSFNNIVFNRKIKFKKDRDHQFLDKFKNLDDYLVFRYRNNLLRIKIFNEESLNIYDISNNILSIEKDFIDNYFHRSRSFIESFRSTVNINCFNNLAESMNVSVNDKKYSLIRNTKETKIAKKLIKLDFKAF